MNFWLPASYHTPKFLVSAVFAGLLTKVGIYALLRITVMLFADQRDLFAEVIAWIAALTMIAGVLGALAQNDIRRIFGYLVISGIGTMLAGIAIGSVTAHYRRSGLCGSFHDCHDCALSGCRGCWQNDEFQ